MRTLVVLLAAASLTTAEPALADFEGADSAKAWTADAGDVSRVEGPVHAGSGALRWKTPKEGTKLQFGGLKGDLTKNRAVRFFAWLEGTVERDLTLRIHTKGGDFWRRFSLRPQVWSEVVVPFYQFRQDASPLWSRAEGFAIVARKPLAIVLDDLSLVEGGEHPQIEPAAALIERVFPGREPAISLSDNFRVFTDAPLDAAAVSARLEEGLGRFRKIFGVEEPLAWPVTLIVRTTPEEYRRTAVETARDVYGGDLSAPTAGGFTFYEYSFTSYDEKQGATRPVFLHEACHQLVSRLLHFQGPNGALWIEEGLCYFMQNEFTPIENAKDEALKMFENPKRPRLASFDAKQRIDSGAENLTAFLVTQYMLKGPHAAQWKDYVEALRENDTNLLKAAQEAFGVKPEAFEQEYEEYTRKWAAEK
ncbi:MAG: hypothetical protein FD180_1554 [Planctomycetota bacterium]|nr:MAG: hypothetical protein FD180_1554 [Planctomycetota bacterium]